MEITWTINKKRGNFRPVLNYRIVLGKDEKDLAIPSVKVDSKIPKPVNSWEGHCYPGQNERGGIFDKETYEIVTPSFKTPEVRGKITLIWKDTSSYPEVENGFSVVRKEIEKEILDAQKSLPINEDGSLDFSSEFREKGAPAIAAERFLKAASM